MKLYRQHYIFSPLTFSLSPILRDVVKHRCSRLKPQPKKKTKFFKRSPELLGNTRKLHGTLQQGTS